MIGTRRLAIVAALVGIAGCASRSAMPAASPAAGTASPADRAAVMGVITGLFDAMRAGDTARMRLAFEPGAQLKSASVRRDGTPAIQTTPIDTWLQGIGRGAPGGAMLDERLRNPIVHVDGTLANVWVEYAFFVGPTFSHCGVDAFVLAKAGTDWKIVSVADSRRRDGCDGWTATTR